MTNDSHNIDWDLLLDRIRDRRCTPFLGAGACYGVHSLAGTIAEEWADCYGYPFNNRSDLGQVAQFIAVDREDAMRPKEMMCRRIRNGGMPDFTERDEPHALLAQLSLPVYVTTNYDTSMCEALKRNDRDPQRRLCQWNTLLRKQRKEATRPGFEPTPARPLVFHFHGHYKIPESIVLTEDDHVEFLVALSEPRLLPHQVEYALTNASLLFIGYSLTDWTFRVTFGKLKSYLGIGRARRHVSIQLVPTERLASPEQRGKAKEYMEKYLSRDHRFKVDIYWGTAREFVADLRRRLGKSGNNG